MNTICTRCGSTDVSCEAMINPNTGELRNYTDDSFLFGWCEKCGYGSVLTDTDGIKRDIGKMFQQFMEIHGTPDYAVCDIVWKKDNKIESVKIGLSKERKSGKDNEVFFNCSSLRDILSLCEYGKEDFIITAIHYLDKWH